VAVLGAEQLGRERHRGPGDDARGASQLVQLLEEEEVGLLRFLEPVLQLLVALLERLHLEPLALARRLRGAAVAEDPLDTALLLLVLRLGPFSRGSQSSAQVGARHKSHADRACM